MIWGRGHHGRYSIRKRFKHGPANGVEFGKTYFVELDRRAESGEPLRDDAHIGTITLVFGAREVGNSQHVALAETLGYMITRHH